MNTMHIRLPRARFSASRILIARKHYCDHREKSGDAERLVNVTQIFTTISPCLPTCFLRRLKNGASAGTQYFSAHYIGAVSSLCVYYSCPLWQPTV